MTVKHLGIYSNYRVTENAKIKGIDTKYFNNSVSVR